MRAFIPTKQPNQVDTKEVRDVKGFIRKTEAISGARYAGLKDDHIHFMALPFYEIGKIMKNTAGEEDIKLTMDLLQKNKTASDLCRRRLCRPERHPPGLL